MRSRLETAEKRFFYELRMTYPDSKVTQHPDIPIYSEQPRLLSVLPREAATILVPF